MYDRPRPPQLDQVMVRLENALAPIRTRIYRARERMAAKRPRPGPSAALLARAAESEQAPADLQAVAQAVREGRTTWEQVAAGDADHLPEMKRFYAKSLERTRRVLEQWHQPDEQRRRDDGHE
jgi:hypothetical protein